MSDRETCLLALEDAALFRGRPFGARGERVGEVVFNTSLTGYQEVLTDPSYAGQIVVMTYPHIGNTGVNREDCESRRVFLEGFVAREFSRVTSNWRASGHLEGFLLEQGVVAMDEVDTRRLVRHIRARGAMKGVLSTEDPDPASLVAKARAWRGFLGQDLAAGVSIAEHARWEIGPEAPWEVVAPASPGGARPLVVAYDFGVKFNILRRLVGAGALVAVVPAWTPAEEVLAMRPRGVVLSNGPGDPEGVIGAREAIRRLAGAGVPILGICLGHQILALALGGRTFKLKFGHRGINQPVLDLASGRVAITAQNHGFAVEGESIARNGLEVTQINLNDGTVEGMRHRDWPILSVQYHPEASPGPHDALGMFAEFLGGLSA